VIQNCSIKIKKHIYRVIYDAIENKSGAISLSKLLGAAVAGERRRRRMRLRGSEVRIPGYEQ